MKASDIVLTLKANLGRFTDHFSDVITVDSITQTGGVATVVTSGPHDLQTGAVVMITGALTPNPITSLSQVDGTATGVTAFPHDLTTNFQEEVTIQGAAEPEYNGTFDFIREPNRNTLEFKIDPSAPAVATGAPELLEDRATGYNGLFEISVVNATTFTYPVDAGIGSPAGQQPGAPTIVHAGSRIAAAANFDRAIRAYTAPDSQDDLWMFVVLGPQGASKARESQKDTVADTPRTGDPRQFYISVLHILVFVPERNEVSGAEARDLMHDIFPAITRSIAGLKFDNGLPSEEVDGLVYVDDDQFDTDAVSAYVHRFTFEETAWISRCDQADGSINVAFRDIFADLSARNSDQSLTADVNLDTEPQ